MTKLDVALERARSLPVDDQDALAERIERWLDAELDWPAAGAVGPDGSDTELARRVAAWQSDLAGGVSAAELHERLARRRQGR